MKTFLISLICFSISSSINAQFFSKNIDNPLSNVYGITLELGGTIPKTDYKIDNAGISGRLSFEYFFKSHSIHSFGIRVLGGAGILKGEVFSNDIVYPPVSDNFNTDFYFLGGGLLYELNIGNNVPYLAASVSYISFNPLDENRYQLPNNQFAIYDKKSILYSIEAGIKFPFSERWSLNLGIDFNFSGTDYLDDIKAGHNNDAFIGFYSGISFYLGKEQDSDNDGVEDDIDLCPDTPIGSEVNEFGCSLSDLNSQSTDYDTLNDYFLLEGIFSDGVSYCFQVDAFQDGDKAEELQKELISLGYKADIYKINFGSRVWHSVRIGYFNSFENAKYFRDDFFRTINLKIK